MRSRVCPYSDVGETLSEISRLYREGERQAELERLELERRRELERSIFEELACEEQTPYQRTSEWLRGTPEEQDLSGLTPPPSPSWRSSMSRLGSCWRRPGSNDNRERKGKVPLRRRIASGARRFCCLPLPRRSQDADSGGSECDYEPSEIFSKDTGSIFERDSEFD